MKIFDAQIRSDTRSEDELRNLQYFDTQKVLTTAHGHRAFEHSAALLAYFEDLVGPEVQRLQRCGLLAYAALGVLPDAQPRRSHREVWRALPGFLQLPQVVAVGEIGAWEDTQAQWALFDQQVRLALEAELPVVITPPADLLVNMTYKMMARLEGLGMEPRCCLMNLLDERLIATVLEEGFVGGVAVGYRQLEPLRGAHILRDVLEARPDWADRVVLNSSLRRGAADILGIPKTIVALGEACVDTAMIEKIAFENADRLFKTDR